MLVAENWGNDEMNPHHTGCGKLGNGNGNEDLDPDLYLLHLVPSRRYRCDINGRRCVTHLGKMRGMTPCSSLGSDKKTGGQKPRTNSAYNQDFELTSADQMAPLPPTSSAILTIRIINGATAPKAIHITANIPPEAAKERPTFGEIDRMFRVQIFSHCRGICSGHDRDAGDVFSQDEKDA